MAVYSDFTDAQLVTAFRAGDQVAFAGIYDRYADRIYSYCLAMLRNRDDAVDAAHEAFLKAATRVDQLQSPHRLRPWLFTIARDEAHGSGHHRAGVAASDHLTASIVHDPDLAMGVTPDELRELVWSAADGLVERDRQMMLLHLVEGLEGEDLAEAMGVEISHLDELLSRMRDRVENALGAPLIARLGSEDCTELPGIVGDGDRKFDTDVTSRVTRHVEGCDVCRERRAFLLAPNNVLPVIMVLPAPSGLRERVLGSVASVTGVEGSRTGLDWAKMGIFAAVALVIGLIGMAVSAQFTPMPATTTIPAAEPDGDEPAAKSTTSTTEAASTTTVAGSTTSGATASAKLQVSDATVDFGTDGTTTEVGLTNGGGEPSSWTIASSTPAISFSPAGGELAGGVTVPIQLTLDRAQIAEGELGETLTISWEGGSVQVGVVGTYEDIPVIHNPQASPAQVQMSGGASCVNTQTTVSARVRDTSPVESVVARWSPTGSGGQETAMSHVGNDIYEAVIGPFTTAHTASVRIVGFDERGNAGGATITVEVVPCP